MASERLGRRELILAAGAAAAACVGCSDVAGTLAQEAADELAEDGAEFAQATGDNPGVLAGAVSLGAVADLIEEIRASDGFLYKAAIRAWLVEYPADSLDRARQVYSDAELAGMEAGFVALSQKCPHLGCRVPSCATSQWFECPCHGSKYNQVGEKRSGPAPRGMDRFAVKIEDGEAFVQLDQVIQGPAIGTDTTGQAAAGPFCIAEAGS